MTSEGDSDRLGFMYYVCHNTHILVKRKMEKMMRKSSRTPDLTRYFSFRARNYLGVGRRGTRVTVLAFPRDSLQVATVSKSLHGIFGQTLGFPPLRDDGSHIQPERAPQAFLGIHQCATLLQPCQPFVVHCGRLGVQLLCAAHRLNHCFDFSFEVVALVHHECDICCRTIFCFESKNLVKDAEYLIGIDGTKCEVVVGIATVIEMKSANHYLMEQPGNDLLNVLGLIVMPGIHEHIRLRTGGPGQEQGHAPISDIRVIERRLKGFVFDQQPLTGPQSPMNFFQSLLKITDPLSNALSPRIIGTIRKPRRDIPAIQGLCDSDAIENMR